MTRNSKAEDPDPRSTKAPAELMNQLTEALLALDDFGRENPMACLRISVQTQGNLRNIERRTAVFANHHYSISWADIGRLFGRTGQWAWERYVETPRKAALSMGSRKPVPPKVED